MGTDLPNMVPLVRLNARSNRAAIALASIDVQPLVLGQTSGFLFESPWDLVCASGVCDEAFVDPLAATLRALFTAQPGITAVLALNDLKHTSSTAPSYARLFDSLDGLVSRRVASISSAQIAAQVGDMMFADAH